MPLQLLATQQVKLTLQAVDKFQNPVGADGTVVWSVSDPTILTLTSDPASQSDVEAVTTGKVGVCTVTAVLTPVTGAPLSATEDVIVAAGPVVSAVIVAATPTDKP